MAKIIKKEPLTDRDIEEQLRKAGVDVKNEQRYPVRLAKDPMNESAVEFVQVNGYAFRIPRGVTVNVPRCVMLVLEDSGLI